MTHKIPILHHVPWVKNGPRTPTQHWFSLEPACCSNSVSHSNKFYSPLILPHVWKFFSKPCMDNNIFGGPYGELVFLPPPSCFSFLLKTLCKQASAVEATEELWPGLPSGVFQMPHCSMRPSSCCPNGRGSLLFLLSN